MWNAGISASYDASVSLRGKQRDVSCRADCRFLNIRLDGITVEDPERHPHMVSAAPCRTLILYHLPVTWSRHCRNTGRRGGLHGIRG